MSLLHDKSVYPPFTHCNNILSISNILMSVTNTEKKKVRDLHLHHASNQTAPRWCCCLCNLRHWDTRCNQMCLQRCNNQAHIGMCWRRRWQGCERDSSSKAVGPLVNSKAAKMRSHSNDKHMHTSTHLHKHIHTHTSCWFL